MKCKCEELVEGRSVEGKQLTCELHFFGDGLLDEVQMAVVLLKELDDSGGQGLQILCTGREHHSPHDTQPPIQEQLLPIIRNAAHSISPHLPCPTAPMPLHQGSPAFERLQADSPCRQD